ncbi:MAG: beta-lactamase family protein [Anaerolineae bacterium]|nr:beta-lactamase family protein [Anaerolineae bacterium]
MTEASHPGLIGLSEQRLARVDALLQQAVDAGRIPGAAIMVSRHGRWLSARCFGRQYLREDSPPIRPDTIFLLASITKPVTVTAAMMLVERGQLGLDDRVCECMPEFGGQGKDVVTIRHLMTHTSGLPDMLPENYDLRREHAPLAEFVRRVCQLELDFRPGTCIRYQSMGILMLAEVIERIAGISLPHFMRQEIFEPLGMHDSSLGYREEHVARIAHVNVAPEMRGTDWGWNTPYWWGLGAPWGGMFSTVGDLTRLMHAFLHGGAYGGVRILSRASVEAMTRDQTALLPELPRALTLQQSWGLGWRRLSGGQGDGSFGDLLSPGSYGHGGATGTVAWNDPARDMSCVLLTTEPGAARLRTSCSNLVAVAAL